MFTLLISGSPLRIPAFLDHLGNTKMPYFRGSVYTTKDQPESSVSKKSQYSDCSDHNE